MHSLAARTIQLQQLFSRVQGNARVIVFTEGISAVPYQWYLTYLTLYMLALGVSKLEVGLFSSLLVLTQLISTLFGGYAADRFGRRWVLVVFDIICWGVPMFLYAIAQNPWYFLVGRFINGFISIVIPAFDCLFVEDVPQEDRPAVFSMMQFFISAASLFTPLAGWMVMAWGILVAGRLIMASCMLMMVGIAVYRWFALRETSIGQERMAATASLPARLVAREYAAAIRSMLRDRRVASFLLVRGLIAFSTLMWGTYAVIYLVDPQGIGLGEALVAYLPFVSSLATLLMIYLASAALRSGRIFDNMLIGQSLWLAAALVFILSPQGALGFVLLSTFGLAVSAAFFQPASQSYWANIVGDQERAQVFSASATLLSLITLPAAPLAGLLYLLSPRLPFGVALVLQVAALCLILAIRSRRAAGALDLPTA